MEDQYSGATTTANSKAEGRLVVGAGCNHGKKKCLKCAMKKDGKGGFRAPGYGKAPARKGPVFTFTPKGKKAKAMKSLLPKLGGKSKSLKVGKKVSLKRMLRKLK